MREEAGAAANTEPPPEAPGEALQAEVASLKVELAEGRERVLRTLAEMENLRRRTERERIDASKFAITRFARDMLTVADNLDRALGTVAAEAAEKDATLKGFFEGVQLTQREFLNVLERHGVKKVEADGQRFDPNLHQAMMEMENPDVPAGTVIKSFQPAYVIEDRILRPAMVVVSKGGPKPAPKPANDQSSPAGGDGESSEEKSSQGEEPKTRAGSQ
ncbi:MAG: nucleotide exchange factor GrpE [Hyphomicrobiaceae bacterium]|nr:MAG: nucleotide exchange factor GrpE [Hyphomicrobiaceae bacterium]